MRNVLLHHGKKHRVQGRGYENSQQHWVDGCVKRRKQETLETHYIRLSITPNPVRTFPVQLHNMKKVVKPSTIAIASHMTKDEDFSNLCCIASLATTSWSGGPLAPASSMAAISSAVSGAS